MGGGLINIVSYGANDLFLTGSPQITFFHIVYRRHTNFSKESVVIELDDLQFGTDVQVELQKNGDLINEIYLQIEIPEVYFTRAELGLSDPTTVVTTYGSDFVSIKKFQMCILEAYRVIISNYPLSNVNTYDITTEISQVTSVYPTFNTDQTTFESILSRDFLVTGYYYLQYSINDLFYISMNVHSYLQSTYIILGIPIPDDVNTYLKNYLYRNALISYKYNLLTYNYYYNKTLLNQNDTYAKFAWVQWLGDSIIDYVDMYIGGEKIDRHYGDWLHAWYQLAGNQKQLQIYNKMMGNVNTMTTYNGTAKPSYILLIPFTFWLCKKSGLAFPIIALQFSPLIINIKLRNIADCCYIERSDPAPTDPPVLIEDAWNNKGYNLSCSLLVDYVYLELIERRRFSQSAHEYLVERIQELTLNDISNTNVSVHLDDFQSPCKELLFFIQKTAYINNSKQWYKSMWWNYSLTGSGSNNPLDSAELSFNGYKVIDPHEGSYYNYVLPYSRHTDTPCDGLNIYSFALFPEEHQPSGSCNFSRIASPVLNMIINSSMFSYKLSDIDPNITPDSVDDQTLATTVRIRIFMITYNILRIMGGMGALAYY